MNWHITPQNDLKEHEELSTCACSPNVVVIDGSQLIIHNAYDQREIGEKLIDKFLADISKNSAIKP